MVPWKPENSTYVLRIGAILPSKIHLQNLNQPSGASVDFDELSSRRPRLQIVFAHRDPAVVERSVQELHRVGFAVELHLVPDVQHITSHPRWQSFDVAVCEFPSNPADQDQLLRTVATVPKDVPLILLGDNIKKETAAALLLRGVSDCVDVDSIGHLPVVVRRTLSEKSLRHERDRAEKELRRLQAHYRALAGNLTYGICRCDPSGGFLDVNRAMVAMMGYCSKEELLSVNITGDIFSDRKKREQLLGRSEEGPADPVESEWKRRDGSSIKVRLSAQEVVCDQGQIDVYEVIVEDVTKQRELEDHLRRLAASDPLTGLANYRHLIDALDKEIRRSNRTGRDFALLLFDMDGLKQLNDSYGHLTGSQALCRTADALTLFCRDIDTAARFGGDEFALLLPETGAEAAHSVARRISSSIAEDSNGPRISVSVGAGVFPRDGETVESLVSAADAAMYAMKRQRKHIESLG
jgi:diguanylate cyclase (GGDEF)-like protein/PAS domain S-box-containing protein